MAQFWNMRLLGGFALACEDRPVSDLNLRRLQLLLAYLALHRATAQPRQRIAGHLWPESTDTQARTKLRKALSNLRRMLPAVDELLLINAKLLQWSPRTDCVLDVAEFETAVNSAEQATDDANRQACWEKAIHLYQGDLLPDCDDEWIAPERERLRQLQQRSLEQLTQMLEQQQAYSAALIYARQLLRLDRLNEATYCTLMRLHHGVGDRANALQTYHQCMTLLRDELGVDPGAATRKLYEQLLHEDASSPSPSQPLSAHQLISPPLASASAPATHSPLIGRETEWAAIQQWGDQLLAASPQTASSSLSTAKAATVLLLLGEPGIGKTRLLEELCATSRAAKIQGLWGCGFAAEMMRPYGLWIDALRSAAIAAADNLPAELGFLLPELEQPDQALPDPSHLFDAVVRSLMQWADQSPLLILLDDIQWLDDASAALLHYAIRVLRYLPVQIACTARTGELEADTAPISEVLKTLRRERRLQTLNLQPLDREQTRDLICNTGGVAPAEISRSLVNQVFIDSGGNPLFALEIARSHGQAQSHPHHTLEALIGDRLQQLDEATRGLLPWAAALGRSFNPSTLANVADYPMPQLLSAFEQLERRSIIRPSTSLPEMGYDFSHDIVRQVVYQRLSAPRRQLIHQQIAHHLQQRLAVDETAVSDVAHHASLGGGYGLAAEMAVIAAEQSLRLFAYTAAVEQARQGIQDAQYLSLSTRLLIQAKLLHVCALAGVRGQEAMQLETQIQQLVQDANSQGIIEAQAIALEALVTLQFDQSNFKGVHQRSLQAAAVSRIANPATTARLLAYSGSCLAEIGRDIMRAEALLLEAQSLADRVGLESCDIFAGLGCIHRHYGRYDDARLQLRQAWRLAKTQQDHWRECTYLGYLAMVELETEQPAAVFPYTTEMITVAANIQGEGSEVAIAQSLSALAGYQLAEPNAAAELTAAVAALQLADAKRVLAYVLTEAAEVDLSQARPQLAIARAEAALKNAQIMAHPSAIALSWVILIQALLTVGDHQRAKTELKTFQETVDFHDVSIRARTTVEHLLQHQSHAAAPRYSNSHLG